MFITTAHRLPKLPPKVHGGGAVPQSIFRHGPVTRIAIPALSSCYHHKLSIAELMKDIQQNELRRPRDAAGRSV
jgi:hypothetical protein